MNNVEILAPAGAREQLISAVRSGANAVYLGCGSFNARRNAENFNIDDLPGVVAYCHARNVKVHVTFNTLVRDDELNQAKQEIKQIAASGVDAIIVQDLGVASLIKKCAPTLKMHASTQLSVHNVSGCKMLEELGFSRVVLARELSLNEIETICKNTSLEVEVFIHGALCISLSGGCYLSSLLGQRSGNRGLCAQPCRLDFKLKDKSYALSLKDLSHIKYIRKLAEIGVCSFKIEGRMKRPEYVACATSACKKALASEKYDEEILKKAFSRSGFTDGYFSGNNKMFGYRKKEDVENMLEVIKPLASLYAKEKGLVPVDMHFSASLLGTGELTVICGENSVKSTTTLCQAVQTRATSAEDVKKQLSKLGETPYFINNLSVNLKDNVFIPLAELNRMRREAIDALTLERSRITPHEFFDTEIKKYSAIHNKNELRVRVTKKEQLKFVDDDVLCFLPPDEIDAFKHNIAVEIPSIVFSGDEKKLLNKLKSLKALGIKKALCNNIGAIYLAKQAGLEALGGWGLNVLNSLSASVLEELGVSDITASFEINARNLSLFSSKINLGAICYGYLPLMRMRACPLERNCKNCTGINTLTDRMNKNFTLVCQNKKYNVLLNSVPLYVGDKKFNSDFSLLYFNLETDKQVSDIIYRYKNSLPLECEATGGLYFKTLR